MKVYLSKSMQSNPDLIIGVKSYIAHHIKDAKIIEFKGGGYTTKLLESSDIVVAIPPGYTTTDDNTFTVNVGKGVYSEIKTANNLGKTIMVAMCLKDQDPLEWRKLSCFKPTDMKVIDKDWKANYAIITGKWLVDMDEFKEREELIKDIGFL